MATITAYATELIQVSGFNSKANISGLEYLTDLDESTEATFDRIYKSENINFLIGNFDFTSIPAGSVINSVAMMAGATTQANITVHIIECRKYTNGSYVSQGSNTSEQFVTSNKSGDFTFTSRIGTWTRDELAISPVAGVQNGPWFHVRIKNSSSLNYNDAYLRYFKMVVDYTPQSYTITVNAGTGGTVTGGGTYESGKTVTLTATANAGYRFKQWSDGNTSATRTITVTAAATYTAQFEKLTYNVSVSASPAEGGAVSGAGVYSHGDTATLTATPNAGYKFKQWSDGSTSATRTITVTAAATYTAQFEKLTYNISASVSPADGGTVSGAGVYSHGDTATLTATPSSGYSFSYWRRGSDGLGNYSNPLSVTVTEGETYTAIFEKLSSTYDGTKLSSAAYIGTKKLTVYCGTKKVL